MDSTPKISFIPKGSLVREESFLERPRPRSFLGFFAAFVFVVSISSYAGIYFYRGLMADQAGGLASEIKVIQQSFDQPIIEEARAFRARSDRARELFDEHTVVTPIFDFLAENTTENVFYHDLKFARGDQGALSMEVSGEAPSYASLAYQADIFRSKSAELTDFSVNNIALSKTGRVVFSLQMTFANDFLSYSKSFTRMSGGVGIPEAPRALPILSRVATTSTATSTQASELVKEVTPTTSGDVEVSVPPIVVCEPPLIAKILEDGSTVCSSSEVQTAPEVRSFWSWFKFW